jgi:hypothetical protein
MGAPASPENRLLVSPSRTIGGTPHDAVAAAPEGPGRYAGGGQNSTSVMPPYLSRSEFKTGAPLPPPELRTWILTQGIMTPPSGELASHE